MSFPFFHEPTVFHVSDCEIAPSRGLISYAPPGAHRWYDYRRAVFLLDCYACSKSVYSRGLVVCPVKTCSWIGDCLRTEIALSRSFTLYAPSGTPVSSTSDTEGLFAGDALHVQRAFATRGWIVCPVKTVHERLSQD